MSDLFVSTSCPTDAAATGKAGHGASASTIPFNLEGP